MRINFNRLSIEDTEAIYRETRGSSVPALRRLGEELRYEGGVYLAIAEEEDVKEYLPDD